MKWHLVFGYGILAAALMISLASCRQPSSGEVPTVSSVRVIRADGYYLTVPVPRNGTADLEAIVEGMHGPPQTVNWYIVDGDRHSGTRINARGVLYVHANEPRGTLTIGARSTFDMRQFGHITLYIEGHIVEELESPQITLAGSMVFWNGVPGAGGYSLRVDGDEAEDGRLGPDARNFNLAGLSLSVGYHEITLVAIGVSGESLDSPPSNTVIYQVSPVEPVLPRLAAPIITLTGSVVVWSEVSGAGGYSLHVDGVGVAGGDLGPGARTFDLADLGLPEGDHEITLVAIGVPSTSLNSLPSNTVIYQVPQDPGPGLQQLPAPVIYLDGETLRWATVSGAGGYSLRVNGIEPAGGNLTPGTTSFNLAGLGLPEGNHFITLVALGIIDASLNSPPSNFVTFTVEPGAEPGLPVLDAPVIELDYETLRWQMVPGADGYSLLVGGTERVRLGPLDTYFSLTGLGLPVGTHVITLVAIGVPGESLSSPVSNAVTLHVMIYTGVTVTVTLPDMRDQAADLDIQGPTFSMTGEPSQIVFDSEEHDVTSVGWFIGDDPVPAGTVEVVGTLYTLTLDSRIHGNMDGPHFVTLEVEIGGRRYSRTIAFTVTL